MMTGTGQRDGKARELHGAEGCKEARWGRSGGTLGKGFEAR